MARRKLHLVLLAKSGDHIICCSSSCPACQSRPAFQRMMPPHYYASALGDRAFGYRDWPGRRKGAKP